MLSIGAMGSGQGNYYIDLAQTDYYTKGGEPPGVWGCKGAEALGLTGQVKREEFLRVFQGFAPKGDRALIQNAGAENHQPGWDLTFSAPKSVSILWSVLDPQTRKAIEAAHFAAIKEAVEYLEETCAVTRRGRGGAIKEPASLVVATFEHGTSRAQDQQLHSHALVLNIGVRPDRTTGTIESNHFYRAKMLLGAYYRAEFSQRLEALGFPIEREGKSFAVSGVPQALVVETSKRRTEIEQEMTASGKQSARAASVAALKTRSTKEHIARKELFPKWREEAAAHGFTQETAQQLRRPGLHPERDIREETKAALERASEGLSKTVSHFSEKDLLRATLEESQGRGLRAAHVRGYVEHRIETEAFVYVGEQKGERRYTTQELYALEKSLLTTVETLRTQKGLSVSERVLKAAILETEREETKKAQTHDPNAQERILNAEQRHALKHITQEDTKIAVISGMAGTGKTFLLSAAKNAWEKEGYRVLGTAISGKAARGLSEGAGMESATIAKLLYDLDPQSRRYPTSTPPLTLTAKTILVVDESGMVGTRQMEALVSASQRSGANLVLVGDARQLQPIEVGGPLRAIENRVGKAELTEIVRQELDKKDKNPYWKRDAVRAFADGRGGEGLAAHAERGGLHISETRTSAMKTLIEKWSEQGISKPQESLIFAGTRTEVRDLNRYAQEARRGAGKLGFRSMTANGVTLYEKDRILITENHKRLKINNGDIGTISRIDTSNKQAIITLDDGREVILPYDKFKGFTLGYAVTTHKSQGVTINNAYVLCGGSMADRELSYVQASRARKTSQFFTEKIYVWDEKENKQIERTIPELSRQMSRSRQKDLAHDVKQNDPKPSEAALSLELLPVL